MYERYWNLETAPFDHDRSSESFYAGRLHKEAIVNWYDDRFRRVSPLFRLSIRSSRPSNWLE